MLHVLKPTKPGAPITSTITHLLVGVAWVLSVLFGIGLALSVVVWMLGRALG